MDSKSQKGEPKWWLYKKMQKLFEDQEYAN